MKIWERLKKCRNEKGYSQVFVAEKIGVKNNTLSSYESGVRRPDFEMLLKLSDLYNVSTDYLIKGETNTEKKIELGARLKNLRLDNNLTAKQLGNHFSLAESTISGYENGNRTPDMDTLNKFADFFNVNIDYLYGRDNKNVFFFDMEDLDSDEINDIKRHIEYVKWKSKQEKNRYNEKDK